MVTWVHQVTLDLDNFLLTVELTAIDITAFLNKPYRSDGFTRRRRTIHVGTGFLYLLEIGSIWHNRLLFYSPSSSSKKSSLLTVTIPNPQKTISTTLQKLALAIDNLTSFHPFSSINEELLYASNCRVLKSDAFTVRDGERIHFLVIPPSEILRFYHCGSESLVKQLLSGGISHDQIYLREATRYDPETDELLIRMRGHLKDADALFVGRLAGDRFAHAEATELGKRIQQNLINHQVSHLDMGFPFAGPTKLTVAGKWLKTDINGSKWAFLVYSIINCTAKLPFKKLNFYRENDNGKTENPLEEKPAPAGGIRQPATPPVTADISSIASPSPGLAKGELPLLVTAEQRFLQAPPVERIQKEQQLVAITGRLPRWYARVNSYTVSDAEPLTGENSVAPVSTGVLPEVRETGTGVDFSQFQLITEELRAQGVTCLYVDYINDWGTSIHYIDFPYPAQPTLFSPAIKRWLLLQTKKTTSNADVKRKRKVIILQLTYGGTSFYLLECEARHSENFSRLLVKPNMPAYQEELLLSRLLHQLAAAQGRWSKADLSTLDIAKQAIHHGTEDTPVTVALRLLGHLKRLL